MSKMMEGGFHGSGLKVAIVAGRFNAFVVDPLVSGAEDTLVRHGVNADDIVVHRCPGAWEIPTVARAALASGKYDALIALGAVIRGGTPHFEYVAGAVTNGLASLAATSDIPVAFGVLTCDTVEQAIERSGTKAGNKGAEAASAVLEMVNLLRAMKAG